MKKRHIGRRKARYCAKHRIAALSVAACLLPGTLPAQSTPPPLQSDTDIASAGFYRLSWQAPDGMGVEIEESSSQAFTTARRIYRGYDRASVISGRPDGEWWYRLRQAHDENEPAPWGQPIVVTVRHHPLSRALMFFILGFIVFIATAVTIMRKDKPAS